MSYRRARVRRRGPVCALAMLLVLLPLAATPALAVNRGSITGVVAGPGGQLPPAGTLVRLQQPDLDPESPGSVLGQATVDPATGAFDFGGVPNGNYLLRAIPPEATALTPSLPVPVSVLGGPVDVGTVALTRPALVGTVYDPSGTRPAPAWIRIHSGGSWVDTAPASGGRVKIGGLPAGSYQLQAWPMEDDPYWGSDPLPVSITPGISQTVSLSLTRADVVGHARDAVGNPVHQAVARVIDSNGQVVHADLTSPSGFFAIGDLPAGSYRLTLDPPWWLGGLIPPAPVPFSVPPLQDLGDVHFQASHKVVRGRVETNTAQPVAGALIEARRLDKQGRVRTLSGVDGAYAAHLSEGLWSLNVQPISGTVPAEWVYPYGPQLVHFQHDTSDEVRNVDFHVVTADSRVVGSITLPDGSAPPFTVTVGFENDAGIGRRQVLPPGQNRFDVALPHGGYKVAVLPDDGGYFGPGVPAITLRPNSTLDLGALALVARDATISGGIGGGGSPLAGIPVVARRAAGQGLWAEARSGPDGGYVLAVVEGTWLVAPAPGPEQPWLYAGEGAEVEVPPQGAVAGVDFELLAADARIRGALLPASREAEATATLPRIEGWAHAVSVADPAVQKGAPIVDGGFQILVPGGTYKVSLLLAPGTPWLAPPAQEVTVAGGGTAPVAFELRALDAAIAGALWDPRAEEVVSGVQAEVMGWSEGSWVRTAVDPGNGTYRLDVAAGLWALGYRLDPAAGAGADYVALRHRRTYPVAAGQVVPAPLPVAQKDGRLAGMVLDPGGDPLAGAAVVAEGVGPTLGDVSLSTVSGEDGAWRLRLPHGRYVVRASYGPGSGWIQPASPHVLVPPAAEVAGLVLQFSEPDAVISGTVNLAGGGAHSGTVHLWAYSAGDGYTRAQAELGGLYSLEVISNTTWTVGAVYQEGLSYWLGGMRVPVPKEGAVQDLELHGPFPLPAPVSVNFDAGEEQYVALADGTSIYIPAGAMPVSGTVTLHVTPIATFPHQRHANVYRYGYAFTAVDAYGRPIEQRFNQEVLITFHYSDAELRALGLSEQWLKPAYFSTTTDSWTFPQSYVVDTMANVVAMQIDHFTDFALTSPAGQRLFLPLVVR